MSGRMKIFYSVEEGMKVSFYLFGVKILEIDADNELELRRMRKIMEQSNKE